MFLPSDADDFAAKIRKRADSELLDNELGGNGAPIMPAGRWTSTVGDATRGRPSMDLANPLSHLK